MDIKTTVVSAAAIGLCLVAAPVRAQPQGILTCQITLSQFAEDVYASKGRLPANQLHQARQIVDVGRSQCRSSPQLVLSDVRSARTAMKLDTGRRMGTRFSDFWPASSEELAELGR
ncbi:MAG TPA: hypothetical protein VK196_18710 [Magnetospirillum sp.]|nr:hypothetical protein [Magnetospirillum sp.]